MGLSSFGFNSRYFHTKFPDNRPVSVKNCEISKEDRLNTKLELFLGHQKLNNVNSWINYR